MQALGMAIQIGLVFTAMLMFVCLVAIAFKLASRTFPDDSGHEGLGAVLDPASYKREIPHQLIPEGSMTAAFASRWSPRAIGQSYQAHAAAFTFAAGGQLFERRQHHSHFAHA